MSYVFTFVAGAAVGFVGCLLFSRRNKSIVEKVDSVIDAVKK